MTDRDRTEAAPSSDKERATPPFLTRRAQTAYEILPSLRSFARALLGRVEVADRLVQLCIVECWAMLDQDYGRLEAHRFLLSRIQRYWNGEAGCVASKVFLDSTYGRVCRLAALLELIPHQERVAYTLVELGNLPIAEVAFVMGRSVPETRRLVGRATKLTSFAWQLAQEAAAS